MKLARYPIRSAILASFVCLSAGLFALPASAGVPQTSSKIAPHRAPKAAKKSAHRPAYSSRVSKARARALARARVAARVRAARDAAVPRYKTDATGAIVPDVHAAAAIIYNPETHQVIWEENSQDKRSIASITKVMTAVVEVESDPDLSQTVTVERSDTYAASTTHLRPGYRVTVGDLLHLMLIASDNAAARALARVSPWGPAGFVERMNEKARELGLESTTYADPSGLDQRNVSSAYDMARLISYAANDERISSVMRTQEFTVALSGRPLTIHSTNRLLARADMEGNILGAKTGFIMRAGYCLATLLKLPQVNQPVAVVVLGAHSNAARFAEVRNLFTWLTARAEGVLDKQDDHQQP